MPDAPKTNIDVVNAKALTEYTICILVTKRKQYEYL